MKKAIAWDSNFIFYLKWISTTFCLVSAAVSALNIIPLNWILAVIGSSGWALVGVIWNDRSLIVLNVFIAGMLFAAWMNYVN